MMHGQKNINKTKFMQYTANFFQGCQHSLLHILQTALPSNFSSQINTDVPHLVNKNSLVNINITAIILNKQIGTELVQKHLPVRKKKERKGEKKKKEMEKRKHRQHTIMIDTRHVSEH